MLEKKTARSAKIPLKDNAEVLRKKPVSRSAAGKSAASRGRRDDVHERVQRRAYELWESEGRPAGREHEHWLQAEREIAISTWA